MRTEARSKNEEQYGDAEVGVVRLLAGEKREEMIWAATVLYRGRLKSYEKNPRIFIDRRDTQRKIEWESRIREGPSKTTRKTETPPKVGSREGTSKVKLSFRRQRSSQTSMREEGDPPKGKGGQGRDRNHRTAPYVYRP